MNLVLSFKIVQFTNGSKIPSTPKVADFTEKFLEDSDLFTAYNRGKFLICGRAGLT